MRTTARTLIFVSLVALAIEDSSANPAFSRQNDLACRACHSVWPNLNSFGREFMVNGFRLEPGRTAPEHLQKLDEHTAIEKVPYVAAKLNGRLYDKSEGADRQLRLLHEVEVFFSGNAAQDFSFNVTIEAEDEIVNAENHFEIFLDEGFAGWHPYAAANVVVGWAQILAMDPYNSLTAGNRKITRSEKSPLTETFASSFAFRENTQFAAVYGKTGGLYYRGAVGTGNDDPEGEDDEDLLVRLAYDLPVLKSESSDSGLAVGALYLDGTNKDAFGVGMNQGFARMGFDFNLDVGNFQTYGLWLSGDADIDALGNEVSNDAYYVEALYLIERNKRPLIFPIVRWESREVNDGADNIDAMVLALGGYIRPNVDLKLEYFDTVEHPNPLSETYRFTLLFDIGL